MKNLLLTSLAFLALISCKCKSKPEILQERQATIKHIIKQHGDIVPPIINQVPDLSDCQKK